MAKTLAQFLPYILPEVIGCSDLLAKQKVISACIEFCEKSHYWRYTHPAINLVKDQKTYSLTMPADAQLVTIIDPVYYNGEKIEQHTKEYLDRYNQDWQDSFGMNATSYTIPSKGVIRPIPYPDAALTGGIEEINLALKPTPAATSVEDFLLDDFFEVIAFGAKGRLMSMPGVEWSDINLGVYYLDLFEEAIYTARTKIKSGLNTDQRYRKSRAQYF